VAKWNEAQQAVLDSLQDHNNILVSAAAGSGKTAVLVERILRSVREGLCHVDEILVVTFTRAAAAEMKTRILNGLTKMAEDNPTKEMYREMSLVNSADITTIDSFCNSVVRENFHLAGVDPAFQIYDSEEAELLKDDVLRDVFDRYYREDPEFREMAEYFISGHISDSKLRDTIYAIHEFAESFASPESWLNMVKNGEGLTALLGKEFQNAKGTAEDLLQEVNAVIETVPGMLPDEDTRVNEKLRGKLLAVFSDDMERLLAASRAETREVFDAAMDGRGPNFPGTQAEELLGPDVKKQLEDLHKRVKDLRKLPKPEALRQSMEAAMPLLRKLLSVTEDYGRALAEEKKRNRRYEFNDIGHFAWQVLSGHPGVAERYREKYKYIYIDEYQDSNDLQENILTLVARRDEAGETCNMFMVGDVKQSIYRFRQARPELFMEKEALYSDAGSGVPSGGDDPESDDSSGNQPGRVIRLNRNYRSRKDVLSSANVIFRHVMSRFFGGILYDESAMLYAPEKESYEDHYPDAPNLPVGGKTELFMIANPEEGEEAPDEELTPDQAEAFILAREIRKMIDQKKQMVLNEAYDPKDPSSRPYRPVEFRDIVVLMRSVRGCTELIQICEQLNVPVRVEDRQGYFDAEEVQIMLSLLSVLDNRLQDIPFAASLLSPLFDLSEEELALVMTEERERMPFSEKCRRFAENRISCEEESLRRVAEKLKNALDRLAEWEKEKTYLTIAELLEKIWEDTGFDRFAAAMPQGGRRLANLNMLQLRAEHFEEKGRKSLFDFIRYIDKCRVNDIDFGEAREDNAGGNVVRVMTMHSSKGLEFPVVFLLRLGRGFNTRERSDNVSMSRVYGLGLNIFETLEGELRVRTKSVFREEIHRMEKDEMLAEEARLLYVAMTRPKERLIMIGREPSRGDFPATPSGTNMKKARCMLDFLIPVLRTDPDAAELIRETDITLGELAKEKKEFQKEDKEKKESPQVFWETLLESMPDAGEKEDPYDFRYAYQADVWMRSKLSVSEVKHAAMPKWETGTGTTAQEVVRESTGQTLQAEWQHHFESGNQKLTDRKASEMCMFDQDGPEEDVTDRVDKEEIAGVSGGALRGTVIHRIMELLPFTEVTENAKMGKVVSEILQGPRFTDAERAIAGLDAVNRFYSDREDSIFQRMRRAEARGTLFRETQFTAGVPAKLLPALGMDTEERTVIQGIIDAWFKEQDADRQESIVIVDYKTDRVKNPQELVNLYRAQMELYKVVLEEITHLPVKKIVLFSTIFGEVDVSF